MDRSSGPSMTALLHACVFDDLAGIRLSIPASMSGDLLQAHGSPAPHWQPNSALHPRSGWFSQTKPKPKQMGQLGSVMA